MRSDSANIISSLEQQNIGPRKDSDNEKLGIQIPKQSEVNSESNSPILPSDVCNFLKSNPLFSQANEQFIEELNNRLHYRQYQPGDYIIKEGEKGRAMFLVIKGLTTVSSKDGESIYAELGSGKFFGEIGVLFDVPRTANVVAKTKCLLAVLTMNELNNIMKNYPDISDKIYSEAESRYSILLKKGKVNAIETSRKMPIDSPIIETGSLTIQLSSILSPGSSFSNKNSNPDFFSTSTKSLSSNEDQNSEEEEVETMQQLRPKFISNLIEPKKRRASIAVWTDQKLNDIANQKILPATVPATPRLKAILIEQDEGEEEDINALDEPKKKSIDHLNNTLPTVLNPKVIEKVLTKLPFKQVWKLRAVHSSWNQTILNSKLLLTQIELSDCHKVLDDEVICSIVQLIGDSIEILLLKNCWKITTKGLKEIGIYCKNLQVIDLCGCWDITDEGIIALSLGCKNLKSIDLGSCRKITDHAIYSLMTNCNNLMDLFLSYCKALSDSIMNYTANLCPNIRRMNLQRCLGISDQGLQQFSLAKHFKLQELILSDCSFLTDSAMKNIAESCPNLRILNISFCCALTETSFDYLTEGCQRIRALDASFCGGAVSDSSIEMMAEKWQELERISVRGCIKVGDKSVLALIEKAMSLRIINISNCKNISGSVLKNMPSHWKSLNAQQPLLEPIGIAGGESFGSSHIRRFTM